MAIFPGMIISALVIWIAALPAQSAYYLTKLCDFLLGNFSSWYFLSMSVFVIACSLLALWPAAGRLRLGAADDRPEFSSLAWYSMIFSAGMGVGIITWGVAEPIYHLNNNPDVIRGLTDAGSQNNLMNTYKWTFFHWGVSAWAAYAICGLSLAYFAYRRGLPLSFRSPLIALFGERLAGPLGWLVNILAVVVTVLGIAHTLGAGAVQLVSSVQRIALADLFQYSGWTGAFTGLVITIIVAASIVSASSGTGRGIKWFSVTNVVLSILLLCAFLIYGSTWLELRMFVECIVDYVINLPILLFSVWTPDGTERGDELAQWQGIWTIFHLAWWIVFAPFAGLFLARISKGRTIREFVVGTMIVPAIMSFLWFTWAGGTAIELEMTGVAQGAINSAPDASKIFTMAELLASPASGFVMSLVIVVLLMTYMITSADSAIYVICIVVPTGDESRNARSNAIIWGLAIGTITATMLLVDGMSALQTAMVVCAAPFTAVILLVSVSLIKEVITDGRTSFLLVAEPA